MDAFTRDSCPHDKYWAQRYRFFDRFDDGIQMDHESWFSVTPQLIAEHIARRFPLSSKVLIDAFCGVGGNAIQFALVHPHAIVIAIDIDPYKLEMAQNNAKIYKCEQNIMFLCGDFITMATLLKRRELDVDAIFLSPPWGGPDYSQSNTFDMNGLTISDGQSDRRVNICEQMKVARQLSSNIALYVPRNSPIDALVKLGDLHSMCEVEKQYLMGKLKTITVYYGELVRK